MVALRPISLPSTTSNTFVIAYSLVLIVAGYVAISLFLL
jgi:hypothetical protein